MRESSCLVVGGLRIRTKGDGSMRDRIFGLETEYGCMAPEYEGFASPEAVCVKVKDHIFFADRMEIMDIRFRGRDDPPGNGGFLLNGGRLYIDMGHLEYATPECSSLRDIVAFSCAGDRIVHKGLQSLGLGREASFLKNNIDHHTGATFGCHENYLIRKEVPFSTVVIPMLLPFLVTRQIFCGAGRVGSYDDRFYHGRNRDSNGDSERDERIREAKKGSVEFQISQRADHIVTEIYQWIQFSLPVTDKEDKSENNENDGINYRRLHLLIGDSNMSEYATALKIGTTAMVINLLERGIFLNEFHLGDPVWAIKEISRDPKYQWILYRHNGRSISAIDLQREYLDLAQRNLKGMDQESDWVLNAWESVLDDLESDPMQLVDRVDWVAKKYLLDMYCEKEGLSWNDSRLQSLDLEYHNVDPSRGLYFGMERHGKMRRILTNGQIREACTNPPMDTRAKARSDMIKVLLKNRMRYLVDWDSVYLENERHLTFRDPFCTYDDDVAKLTQEIEKESKEIVEKALQTDGSS